MTVMHSVRTRALSISAALTVFAAVLVLIATPQSASAVDDGTLGVRPADESNFFHLSMYPGATLDTTAIVSNHTGKPVTLLTYPVDAINSATGFAMADMAAPRVGVGKWVQLEADEVVVPPRSEVEVPVTVTVPTDTPPGQYAGALIIQSPPARGATTTMDGGTSVRLDVVQRQGLRIYLEVEGEAITALEHGELTWRNDGDGLVFSVPLTNTGNTILHPTAELNLTEWTGSSGKIQFNAPESLLPGATSTLEAAVPNAAAFGAGNAEVTITSEAGKNQLQTSYAYAPLEILGLATLGLSLVAFATWRFLRFLRLARAAIAQTNRRPRHA